MPRGKNLQTEKNSHPYIRVRDMHDGFISKTDLLYVPDDVFPRISRYIINKNNVFISIVGTIGLIGIIDSELDGANLTENAAKVCVTSNDLLPQFLVYYLSSREGQNQINSLTVGTTQPKLALNRIEKILVPVPTLKEQEKIIEILSSLDDKIELNRQMNQTLEAMARTIFKSWFVDFDPVYAKMEGRDYPLPPEIMDLFPDELEESELGLIPKGWKISSLEKIADYLNGLALQKYPPENDKDKLPVIKIRELRSGSPDDQSNFATSNLPDEYVINDGDILFSWSGSLLVRMWCGGKGALNQHLFKVTSKKYPKWFYYLWTEHHLKEFQRIAADKATTMGHIKRHHLQDAKVITPNSKLIELGTQYVYSIIEKILLNSKIENLLIQKRELLLPKLISGEIEV